MATSPTLHQAIICNTASLFNPKFSYQMFPAGVCLQNGPLCTNYDNYLMSFLFTKDLKDRDFLQWKTSSAGPSPIVRISLASQHHTDFFWMFMEQRWIFVSLLKSHGNSGISSVGPLCHPAPNCHYRPRLLFMPISNGGHSEFSEIVIILEQQPT